MAKRDFYEVLGVQRGANEKTVKAAYRNHAKKYHPDRGNRDGHEPMARINAAPTAILKAHQL